MRVDEQGEGVGPSRLRRASLAGAVALLLVTVAAAGASAEPRESEPLPPPEREEDFHLDVDALAHSLIDLPDPLPAPPSGIEPSCTKLAAKPGAFPLFDGERVVLAPRHRAQLCSSSSDDGPHWTLTWSGIAQDPDIPGTGGILAWGLWTLSTSNPDGPWTHALGGFDDGRQFTWTPSDFLGGPPGLHRLEGRYLDRGRLSTTTTTSAPLVLERHATTSSPPPPPAPSAPSAAGATPVPASPTFTG